MLVLARLFWRLLNVTPKDPEGISPMQAFMAHAMHWLLYAIMLAQPVSGILMSQFGGFPVTVFGLFEFPMMLWNAFADLVKMEEVDWFSKSAVFDSFTWPQNYSHLKFKTELMRAV